MTPADFATLESTQAKGSASAVFDRLEALLRAAGEHHRLFEALLMRARHELGLPLVQTGPASDMPAEKRTAYEDRIVGAGGTVGQLFLEAGDLATAFHYFNMIGDTEPIRAALDAAKPKDENDAERFIEIALVQGIHPKRGLELVLDRFGICQAITSCEQLLAQGLGPAQRAACIQLLVQALHRELVARLSAEVEAREGTAPAAASVPVLLKGRDWLVADENYHIDTSHLNAVVRFARLLPKCPEVFQALQLCEYGQRLSSRYRYPDPPPFEDVYADSAAYLKVIAGVEVDRGLAHFRAKADATSIDEGGPYPAEIYIHLLLAAGRTDDAVAYAATRLNRNDLRFGLLAGVNELCQSAGRFDAMTNLARERQDPLGFVAGLLQKEM